MRLAKQLQRGERVAELVEAAERCDERKSEVRRTWSADTVKEELSEG